jgi:hypothetical protein
MIRCSIQKRGVLLSKGSLIDAEDLLLPYAKNNAVQQFKPISHRSVRLKSWRKFISRMR